MSLFVCNFRKLSYIPKILSSNGLAHYTKIFQTFAETRSLFLCQTLRAQEAEEGKINLMSENSLSVKASPPQEQTNGQI